MLLDKATRTRIEEIVYALGKRCQDIGVAMQKYEHIPTSNKTKIQSAREKVVQAGNLLMYAVGELEVLDNVPDFQNSNTR